MKIKLNKITDGKWHVLADNEIVGVCKTSHKFHGCYETTLNNGTIIHAFNQDTVKELVLKSLSNEDCDCENTESRFYQEHGCCEHCFYI